MIYEAYQGKVLKVANVLKKIFKHIALIISVISAVVLLVIAFLSTKGIILEVGEVKPTISYGENMVFEVDALFSKVEYEYSAFDGDEWSTVEPTLVGKYKVRGKSFSSFGRNKYTDEYIYEIAPKAIDINIVSDNIIYGETPKISTTLAKNDKLECKGFVFEDITQKKTNVKADIEQIAIYDENNQDITFCYTINAQNKSINISTRPIAITVSSKTMEYNGTTLAFDGYEISDGTLAYADRLGAEFNSSIKDVGSVVNEPKLTVRNADGIDVSVHYAMHISTGTLTVTQRPIVVITPSDEKTYDGEKLENTSVIIYYGEEKTTEGPTQEETTLGGYIEETTDPWWEVESTDEIIWDTEYPPYDELTTEEWLETESATMDTSDHYWIHEYTSWEQAYDTFVEYQIHIDYPYHYDMEHDGYCDFCWEYIGDTRGHDYVDDNVDDNCDKCVDNIYEYGYVQETTHTHYDLDRDDYCDYCWESIGFYEGVPELLDGELVTEAPYDVDILEEPTYYVETTPAGEQTTSPNEEYTTSGPKYIIDTTKPGVIDGHTIYFDRVTSITDAGVVDNIIHIGVYDENGVDKTANYSLFYDFGKLTVNKRQVTVTTPDASWVYDGKVHSTDVEIGGDGIVDGHQTHVNATMLLDVDSDVANIYEIFAIIDANGTSVIDNYEITETFGTIEVRRRPICVKGESGSYMYDGKEHSLPGITYGSYNDFGVSVPLPSEDTVAFDREDYNLTLVEGHRIEVVSSSCFIDYTYGPAENVLEYVILDSNGNDVTDNYAVANLFGEIEITKRPITLSSASGSYVYDGYSHNDGQITVGGEYGLAPDQTVAIQSFKQFINATDGNEKNNYQYEIINANGETVTENYDVTNDWGYISVSKRPLEYKTQSYSGIYDGYEHTFPDLIFDESAFDGMAFMPSFGYDAPVVKNHTPEAIDNVVSFEFYDDNGDIITDNFELSCTEIGTLYVRRREITVSSPTSSWRYDGNIHSAKQVWFGGEGIALPDYYYETSGTEVKNNTFGPVENVVEYTIEDMFGADVSDNYLITDISYGTLEITPIYINIESYDSYWIYDGYRHSSDINIFDANSGDHIFGIYYSDPDGFYLWYSAYGDTAELTVNTVALGWTDGPVENTFEITIYDGDGNDSINDLQNYIINNISYGSLTIEKRPIQYTTGTMSWVYDGQYHYFEDLTVNEGDHMGYYYYALADGDIIDVIGNTSIIDVKQSGESNLLEFVIFNKEGDDVTNCYDISVLEYGTLNITKRRVNYTSSSNTWEYDGLYHSDNSFTINTNLSNTYDLVAGDILSFETSTQIINVSQRSNYLYNGTVYSTERGMDVTDNYDIRRYGSGTLTITPRKITIKPVDANKVYDGKEITVNEWEYVFGSKTLIDGHSISNLIFENATHTNAGNYMTNISKNGYIITDADGNNVTGNYELTRYSGQITIEKLHIVITSNSASKQYDGTALVCHEYSIKYINGIAIDGHVISIDFTGRITGVGIVDNSFENVVIYDENSPFINLADLNYTVETKFGKLEITGIYVGKLWSSQDGYEYIKTESFGDYLGNGFATEPEYPYLTHDGFTPDYLVGIALNNKGGYSMGRQLVLLEMQGKMYFPNYLFEERIEENMYEGRFFSFPTDVYGDMNLLKGYLGEYADYEDEYRGWVYDNYLSINDYDTWAFMLDIINAEGFDVNDYSVYDDVAKYIQNSASYGFDFDPALDSDSNIAVSFLSHKYGDQGVCRHYATAATMLYRALGIPARYTEGYLVKTEAKKQWHDVYAPGHAWVEVYIDELGWVPVEVTAGSDGFELDGDIINGAGLGGITDGVEKTELKFKPIDMMVEYTGDYVYHEGKWQSSNAAIIKQLENQGYYFDVVIKNESAKDIGVYSSYIESVRVYYNGEDVTYKFDIIKQEGVINIGEAIITVKPTDDSKVYDGTPLYAPQFIEGEGFEEWMFKGYRFEYDIIGEITNVGITYTYIDMNTFKIYDPDGIDVTDNFIIDAETGSLEITPFVIDIFLYRRQKEYDGTPLKYSDFAKNHSVLNQLPNGITLDRFDVNLSMTDVGYLTVEDLNGMAWDREMFSYELSDELGNDVTDNFSIRFVRLTDKEGFEKDYIPVEVTARKLTITTASESRVEDGTPLENNTFEIDGPGFADGQYIEFTFEGICENAGDVVENRVVGYTLYDKHGEVLQFLMFGNMLESGGVLDIGNYEITVIFGTLELLPDDSNAVE